MMNMLTGGCVMMMAHQVDAEIVKLESLKDLVDGMIADTERRIVAADARWPGGPGRYDSSGRGDGEDED